MRWVGKWRNQYGSLVDITDDADHRITGTFSTALRESGFFGHTIPVVGVHEGDCVSFTFAHHGPNGDLICSFTGLLRDGNIFMMWHVVTDNTGGWAHSVQTNMDTFERVL